VGRAINLAREGGTKQSMDEALHQASPVGRHFAMSWFLRRSSIQRGCGQQATRARA